LQAASLYIFVVKPLADCKLYTFVDTAYLNGRAPELVAQQLCDGGSDLIQLRAKNSSPDEIRAWRKKFCQSRNARTSASSSTTIWKSRANSARNFATWDRRISLTPDTNTFPNSKLKTQNSKLVLSTHSPEQAQRALDAGPDYIAIGPVFATGTKPGANP
jgi:thiamine-phosphate pyrophosphorylase